MWCSGCERCFQVFLSKKPDGDFSDSFFAELDIQLGVELGDGQIYATCPYDSCDEGPLSFGIWDDYRKDHNEAPEIPQENTIYPWVPLN
tara:strand:- start:270 stop:536 length:267 start_codon:yes stop_codon:yes gene_type:complete